MHVLLLNAVQDILSLPHPEENVEDHIKYLYLYISPCACLYIRKLASHFLRYSSEYR